MSESLEQTEPSLVYQWVTQALAGDQGASRQLVEHLYPVVIRIVRSHLPRRMDEQDLAQEVYMKVFDRLPQYRRDVPVEHWVSRIAVTTCIDKLRSQKRRPELRLADLTEDEAAMVEKGAALEAENDQAAPLKARDLVAKVLETLSPEDRLIVSLLELEEKSLKEVQLITGWNLPLIKVRAFRARQKLKKHLEKLKWDI
ncbi:MAG: RNA polymerase sigma factor [Verrucomicrobiota bacterium]|nr:RNA polymerase sigma factor [Verrucomicrobiota bacterium]